MSTTAKTAKESRIGKQSVAIPSGVKVTINDGTIEVTGPKGRLTSPLPKGIAAAEEDGKIRLRAESGDARPRHGLARALLANAVKGVTDGFTIELDIVGVGYKAEVRPYGLQMALGYSHPIEVRAPQGIKLTAPNPTTVIVDGADKEIVGQIAAEIRSLRPPEPYKGKGVKYQGEVIRRKAGKAGGK